jgi:hypothetical protein
MAMDERIPIKPEYCNSIIYGLEKIGYKAKGITGLYTPKEIEPCDWRFYLPGDLNMKRLPVAFMGKDCFQLMHQEERISGTETYHDHHIRIKKIVTRILKEGVI